MPRLPRIMRPIVGFALVPSLLASCGAPAPPGPAAPAAPAEPLPAPGSFGFHEVTAGLGLTMRHDAGRDGSYYMPEVVGSGVALLDYDGDGRLDVLALQAGGHHARAGVGAEDRLFHQLPDGRFEDATEATGLGDRGYGMGVAVGDIDNDGDEDVFIANDGPDRLYRNNGDGTFTDVTRESGIREDRWSTAAAFFDPDGDGWLDLYVSRYVAVTVRPCRGESGERDYCGPSDFEPLAHQLWRNRGGGRFEDASAATGIGKKKSSGFGVVCLDLSQDGLVDLYVANDMRPNFAWIQKEGGGFEDRAMLYGLAVSEFGMSQAGMGVAVGDVEGDLDFDVLVTNMRDEPNALYVQEGPEAWRDGAGAAGLAAPSLPTTGWGAVFFDLDEDGDEDLVVANGSVRRRRGIGPEVGERDFQLAYGETNQVFENDGRGHYTDVSARSGDFAVPAESSRALAAGDLDGDGDMDLIVSNDDGPLRAYRNEVAKRGHRLLVDARDRALGREMLGAEVTVIAGGRRWRRIVHRAGSFLSSHDPRVHFGLGDAERADSIEVRWPDGSVEHFPPVPAGHLVRLWKGEGKGDVLDLAAEAAPAAPAVAAARSSASPSPAPGGEPPPPVLPGAEPPVLTVLAAARAAVDAAPASAESWGRYGMLFQAHLAPEIAVRCYTRAIELAPGDRRWTYLRALARMRSDPAAALADIDRVLEARPADAAALVRRAQALRALGRPSEAAAAYRRALGADPASVAAHVGLAQLAAGLGELREALGHLEAAVAARPGVKNTRQELARILYRLGRSDEARAEMARAERLPTLADLVDDPLLDQVHASNVSSEGALHRAARLHAMGDLRGALAEFDRAAAVRPDLVDLFNNRALLREALGDRKGAAEDLAHVLELRPDYAPAWINRAVARHAAGDFRGALADLDEAIRHDPENVRAHLNRGLAWGALGDSRRALADYDRAAALAPDDPEVLIVRADGRQRWGDAAGARADRERARLLLASRDQPR